MSDDKHLDDLYDTSKLKVPADYGTTTCFNCGWGLNQLFQCVNCHAQYDQSEVVFHVVRSNEVPA